MRETRRHMRGIVVTSIASGALVAGSLTLAAAPAQAATGTLSGPTTAYVNQPVTFNATNVAADGMGGNVSVLANGIGVGTQTIGGLDTMAFSFNTLNSPGTEAVQLQVNGETVSTSNLTVTKVPTSVTVNAPNTAQVGVATKIQVVVQSNSPSAYTPTGQVVVKDGQGNVIQTLGLTNGPGYGQAYAYWWFTAPSSGNYVFQATYNGDGNALAAPLSPQDIMYASPSGNTITLTAPGTMTVGVPVTLTASFVPANIQGSVGFTFNGAPISASVPITNGTATFNWTPTTPGAATLGASYMTNGGASGSTTDKVNIVAGAAQNDVITLTQPGYGAWAPNGTYSLPNGSSTTMTASTLSGAPVTLTETGPCSVSGLTITVPVGSGTCNIQAKSAGGNGYAPVTYGYTVQAGLGQQTAVVAAPQSGHVAKGRVIVLETPDQADTNAGQNINWSITQGKGSVCKLIYPNSGAVNLKMLKKGTCTVKGFAPGIPNQWAPYTVMRTYKA